jgi:hypothetical protein
MGVGMASDRSDQGKAGYMSPEARRAARRRAFSFFAPA